MPAIYKHTDDILAKRKGIEEAELQKYKADAIADPAKQAWLFQRLYPFMAPYKCKDGEYILPMATFNRRLATGYCKYLGFMDEVGDARATRPARAARQHARARARPARHRVQLTRA